MNKTNIRIALLLSALSTQTAYGLTASLQTTGGTAGQTFPSTTATSSYHPESRTWFVGLRDGVNGQNSIVYVTAPATADTVPTFTGLVVDTTAANRNKYVGNLSTVADPTTPSDLTKVKIIFTADTNSTTPLTAAHLLTTTGGTAVNKIPNDANGAANAAIYAIRAGNTSTGAASMVFAAVQANGGGSTSSAFLSTTTTNSGIAALAINNTTLAMTQAANALQLDLTQTHSLNLGNIGSPITVTNSTPCMAYDAESNRLYVGFREFTTDATHTTKNAITSIAIFDVTPATGALTQLPPFTASYSIPRTILGTASGQYIIAQRGSTTAAVRVSAQKLAVMTTSTLNNQGTPAKFKYLIVNGGNNTAALTGNQVWAIPLVVGNTTAITGATPNTAATYNGTFAAVTTGNFTTPAAAANDLYLTTSMAAKVGAGPLPATAAAGLVQEMHVYGDTVYCSLATAQTNAIEGGVFASQALFDNLGKISGWTEWHRVSPQLSTEATSTLVSRFAVDSVDSHMWMVNGGVAGTIAANLNAYRTTWTKGTAAGINLASQLNLAANLGNGCTSALDLNSSSINWGNITAQRVALFGGAAGKVCFAITGSAVGGTATYPSGAGTLLVTNTGVHNQFASSVFDYSSTTSLLKTTISGAGTVRCLGWTGWTSTTQGFFLAGVENDVSANATEASSGGLYAYALASLGNGFNASTFAGLRSDVGLIAGNGLNAFSWQQLTRIDGVPKKIASSGGHTYILTQKDDGAGTRLDRIFRMTKSTTASLLNQTFVVTASSGVNAASADLSAVSRIYDFVLTQTGTAAEQLAMLTNDGIYVTVATGGTNGTLAAATAQTTCAWARLASPATLGTFQLGFFRPTHTEQRNTAWFLRWVASAANSAIYNNVTAQQLNRNSQRLTGNFALNPSQFNSITGTTAPTLNIGKVFFSDGNRRFLVSLNNGKFKLQTVPFDTRPTMWQSSPNTLMDAALDGNTVYWMSPVGDSGMLMAGMDTGVAALA